MDLELLSNNSKWGNTIMKKRINNHLLNFSFLTIIALSFLILSPSAANAQEDVKTLDPPNKTELLKNKVVPEKVDSLLKKMNEGVKLDSDKYLEQELPLATSENQNFRKDFPDGSFVESVIEDITEEVDNNLIRPAAITPIGKPGLFRTLRISHTAPWGNQAFTVKIHLPLTGYAEITRAYDWYYVGLVGAVDYRGIYRAKETAKNDAVAIQRLKINVKDISFIAKFDFRVRGGTYWTVYKS